MADHDDSDDHGSNDYGPDHDGRASGTLRPLALALAVNTTFLVVEVAGALYAGSLTLLADAVHMLADSASLGLALVAAWVATRPADARRTYGYRRAEVLGALANAVLLFVAVGYVVVEAVGRFGDPPPVRPLVVVGVGVLGLGANLVAARLLAGHRDSLNVRAAFVHLLADAAGSVVAVVMGLVLAVRPWYVLDPILALVVAALVCYSAVGLLRESVNVLLQGVPGDVDVDAVAAYLAGLDGVREVHDVHVWALSSDEYAMSAHLVVGDDADGDALLGRVRAGLGREFGVDHATIQVESPSHVETATLACYAADGATERGDV